MENDTRPASPDDAQAPLAPGPLIRIGHGALVVDIAPRAGGRLAQIAFDDEAWLVGHDDENDAMIAWGCFPMLPWAGRVRRGQFGFDGRRHQLPVNLGDHAIHGVAFGMPWHVDEHTATCAQLSLRLPEDKRWPFGGVARQLIEVDDRRLRMTLALTAGECSMPVTVGWHPWFLKPDRLDFSPSHLYPRDGEGIAQLPLVAPAQGPWDDCFLGDEPVLIHRRGQCATLTSDCNHWVVYDQPEHATCVEPQSGPPDAFNLGLAEWLAPRESLSHWFQMAW